MPEPDTLPRRQRIAVFGAVQGVGFRPFVYRLATELGLAGEVSNSASGAWIEVEGAAAALREFAYRLERDKPPACAILARETTALEPAGLRGFRIAASDGHAAKTAIVLPDLAPCPDCLAEIRDSGARRFGYPFTNCTNCGPRFTIVRGIPYDRPLTSMAGFPMCAECRAEYENVADRRFHAQPIACPACGPKLDVSVVEIAAALADGRIVALKGIGGFQLLCDARNAAAVGRLRQRKHREEKPLAVMFADIGAVRAECLATAAEENLLTGSAAPIVLLRRRGRGGIAEVVYQTSPYMGAMLPSSPLHHLLLAGCGFPVVATSGNLSDEPIAIGNEEARARLGAIADVFATHDRPVVRPCDDSVVRMQNGHEVVLRRARGYAPLPVMAPEPLPRVLAVGAHLKNAVAIAIGRQVFLSQHIGDLESMAAEHAFLRAIDDLCELYQFKPELVACDLHPDYSSTRHAETLGLPVVRIQHHMAHVAACAAENRVAGPYLGVAWDGSGYGTDGTVWGSEFFAAGGTGFERIAHLRPFRLPAGEGAIRDCRKTAFSLLGQAGLDSALSRLAEREIAIVATMLRRGLNSPVTTSMGRLFDAVAVVAGIATRNGFEGQAPMLLESAIAPGGPDHYPAALIGGELDWRPLLAALVGDVGHGVAAGDIARRFHNTLAEWIVAVAGEARLEKVVLSGGVFQNSFLVERAIERLTEEGFRVYTHQRVPPNDGGIALGQAVLAGR